MTTAVRRLTSKDAVRFREVELEALRRHPEAFSASYEEQRDVPCAAVAERLRGGCVFGGFIDDELGAIATYQRGTLRKRQHVAMLSGMYARERVRGVGLARALLGAVIAHAEDEVDQLELYVAVGNGHARRFYERFGFRRYGVMPRALRVEGVDHDADMMVLTFR